MELKLTKTMVGITVVASAIFFSACSGSATKKGSAKDLTVTEFSEVVQNQDSVIILDVATDQYGDIMIIGAESFPISTKEDATAAVKKYGVTKPYAVYDTNGKKSKMAADMLAENGATVYNLKDGLVNWIEEDQIIVIMPLDSTMTTPVMTTKSTIMKDSTMMTKLKIK